MPALWQVLVRMLAEGQAGHPPTATTLLKGSRKYLERLWVEHMSTTIHANRAQVRGSKPPVLYALAAV